MQWSEVWPALLQMTYGLIGLAGTLFTVTELYLRRRWRQEDAIEKRRSEAEARTHEKLRKLEDEKSKLDAASLFKFGERVDQIIEADKRQDMRMERFDGRMNRYEATTERLEARLNEFERNFVPVAQLIHKMGEAQLKIMHSEVKGLPEGKSRVSEKTGRKP